MANRPKRVSLKGKGADIFFGDYAPATDASEAVTEQEQQPAESSDQPAVDGVDEKLLILDSAAESSNIDKQTSVQERKQANKRASKHEAVKASKLISGAGSVAEIPASLERITGEVWASVETPATITNSFRYTEAELEAVADVLYEIGRNRGPRLTKQDIARLGLNVVLDDYRRRGPASLLGQLAVRRRPRHGG